MTGKECVGLVFLLRLSIALEARFKVLAEVFPLTFFFVFLLVLGTMLIKTCKRAV